MDGCAQTQGIHSSQCMGRGMRRESAGKGERAMELVSEKAKLGIADSGCALVCIKTAAAGRA